MALQRTGAACDRWFDDYLALCLERDLLEFGDLVIEDRRDGAVVGIEVKASTRVHPADRRGLRKLRDALGERFRAGVVFHTGPNCVRYADGERIIALPVDRIWSGAET